MPSCAGCGTHVSQTYARVKADREGAVYCPNCDDVRPYDVTVGLF